MSKTSAKRPKSKQSIAFLSPELSSFVENLSRYFESYGIPRIGGRILGLLMVAPKPLSSEDIASILKASRASVSTNLRFALQIGLAEKVTFIGDRISYYAFPESGLEKALGAEIQAISTMQRFVEQGLSAVPPDDPARNRLEILADWAEFLTQVWQKALTDWRERQQERLKEKAVIN
jgi:DNA-binding transcriptional regulator GbsR (MarR family)